MPGLMIMLFPGLHTAPVDWNKVSCQHSPRNGIFSGNVIENQAPNRSSLAKCPVLASACTLRTSLLPA